MSADASVQPPARNGAPLIIAATAIAGIAGYAVTFLVLRFAGAAEYAVFAAFWAALYLVVGGVSGIQQEIARATRPVQLGSLNRASKTRNFALICAGLLVVVIFATGPVWAHLVFRSESESLVFPLVLGTCSYVLVAALTGTLYGLSQWRSIFLMIVTDGLLRLILVLIVLFFTRHIVWVSWAAVLPFPLTIAFLWRFIRPGVAGRSDLDVGYRRLTSNVARTVLASVSTAVLVSGFPLLLAVAGKSASPVFLGHLIFTITITRAPLIVVVMSLQSFFVVRFRDSARSSARLLALILGALLLGGLLLSALAWWIGPPILNWLFGEPSGMDGELVLIIVISSALVSALTVAGSAVLARSRHFIYSFGWVLAAATTIIVMLLPLSFTFRVQMAILAGPIVGLIFHCSWIAVNHRQPSEVAVPMRTDE